MKIMKINILGTDYKIKENCNIEDYSGLIENEAYTDFTTKEIIIGEFGNDSINSVKDINYHIRKVKRHEIVHSLLFESGLDNNTDWARNEEIIDWIAMQYPKMKKIFEKLNIEN